MDNQQTGYDEIAGPPAGPTPRFKLEGPVEYALRNELTVDFWTTTLHWLTHIVDRLQQQVSPMVDGESASSRHLTETTIPSPVIPSDEPRDISIEVSAFLSAIEFTVSDSPPLPLIPIQELKKLRLEEPVIKSNNNLDLEKQSKDIGKKLGTNINGHNLPLQPVNVEAGEAVELSESGKVLWHALEHPAYIIRLDTEASSFLPDGHELKDVEAALRRWDGDELAKQLLEDEYNDVLTRKAFSIPFTPVLAPKLSNDEPFIPSADASHVGHMLDPISLDDDDLELAEESLQIKEDPNYEANRDGNPKKLAEEAWRINGESEADESSVGLATFDTNLPNTANIANVKLDDRRVSTPIFPRSSPLPTFDAGHVFEGAKENEVLRAVYIAKHNSVPQDPSAHDRFFDVVIHELAAAKTEEAEKQVTHENLKSLGNNSRLLVPCMVFDIPPPDWQKKPETPQAHIGRLISDRSALPWGVDVKISVEDKKKLRWTPFTPCVGRVTVDMPVQLKKDALMGFFKGYESADILDVAAVGTRDTRVLKCLEKLPEDEEFIALDINVTHHAPPGPSLSNGYLSTRKRRGHSLPGVFKEAKRQKGSSTTCTRSNVPGLLVDPRNANAAGDLLSTYLSLHAPEKAVPKTSSHFVAPTISKTSLPAKVAKDEVIVIDDGHMIGDTPAPQFQISGPGRFIISLNLGTSLARRIEKHYPGVELLDRDYTKHNTLVWSPGSGRSAAAMSPLSFEADIAVSPATGIIVTTLAKCRQKFLPGNNHQASIREKVARLSTLYERLIVVVSEGNPSGEFSQMMSIDDVRAHADFVGFTATLNASTRVVYVGGGEDTLAKWIVALMCKHNHETTNTRQVAILEETTWEKFLRQAGMNVYAAQVLIAALGGSGQGLVEFLQMTAEERIQRFGALFGGSRILCQVSTVLDQKWGLEFDKAYINV